MSKVSKFLVLNTSVDNLDKIFGKANSQNSKNGPFEAILLLGDVLPNGSKLPNTTLDAPTYFSKGEEGLSNEIQIQNDEGYTTKVSENLLYLNSPINVVKLPSGLIVAYLSRDAELEENQKSTLERLDELTEDIDLLVTYDWPLSIADYKKLSLVGNKFIDEVVKKVKPRYHFAVGNKSGRYLELDPFKWSEDKQTRFISLDKESVGPKWFYSFGISKNVISSQNKCIANPFLVKSENSSKRSVEALDEKSEAPIVKKPKVVSPSECFFCLSNPQVATHMIVSIGSSAYLTIAKGPLTRPNKHTPFAGHAIIIPIEHIPSLRSNFSQIETSPVYQETRQFENSLAKAFNTSYPEYQLVSFEVSRATNIHSHVQVLPILSKMVAKFPQVLNEKADINNKKFEKNHKLNFVEFKDFKDPELLAIMNSSDYIMFVIHESEEQKGIYIAALSDASKMIDLQFPRRVLASVLNCPKRTYWEKCAQSKSQEIMECDSFKSFYANFDFTLH